MRPVLLITRRLPQAIEARAARDYEARLTPSDTPLPAAELLRRAEGAEAVLCCPGDLFDARCDENRFPAAVALAADTDFNLI